MQQQLKTLKSLNVRVAAISGESMELARGAAKSLKLEYPLLPDVEHKAAAAYQVYYKQEKLTIPALYLIDPKGKVVHGRVGVPHGPFDPGLEEAITKVKASRR